MYKTLIVLNEDYTGNAAALATAIGHVAQAVGAQMPDARGVQFTNYADADGHRYPPISWWPVVVLSGRASKLWQYLDALEREQLPRSAFLSTMFDGGSEVQLASTAGQRRHDIGIVAVGAFGDAETLKPLTKRFSLWRPDASRQDRPAPDAVEPIA